MMLQLGSIKLDIDSFIRRGVPLAHCILEFWNNHLHFLDEIVCFLKKGHVVLLPVLFYRQFKTILIFVILLIIRTEHLQVVKIDSFGKLGTEHQKFIGFWVGFSQAFKFCLEELIGIAFVDFLDFLLNLFVCGFIFLDI